MKYLDTVILIHGLNRTSRSFNKMEQSLLAAGYSVKNINYPSQRFSIETLVDDYLAPIIKKYKKNKQTKIHFVTHSLGGILLRYYLQHNVILNLGNVVMLSPPNQGSEIVDMLKNFPGFKLINGPAGQQLSTAKTSLPNKLLPVDYPVGIITGNRSINPILSCIIPGENDGKVSVKRARVKGMRDFITVPYSHTMLLQRTHVIQQTCNFLMNSRFNSNTVNY